MSQSILYQFPMDRVTMLNTIPLFRILQSVVQVFLMHGAVYLVGRLFKFLSSSNSQIENTDDFKKAQTQGKVEGQKSEPMENNDMEIVMGKLGICLDPKGEKIGFDNDFTKIFEEKEPSLEEVKEAFDVFDENKDGFVDEKDLHRVLCSLGLLEKLDMQNCKRMISKYDENGDGRIEFKEFVKIMEKTFC